MSLGPGGPELTQPQSLDDPLDCPDADPEIPGSSLDALAVGSGGRNGAFDVRPNLGSAQPLALRSGSLKACTDTLLDHRPLELGEHPAHLEHRLAGGRGCVNALLMQVQVDTLDVDVPQEADQVLKRAPETIHRPRHDQVELAADSVLEHRVEGGPLVPPLGAADPVVDVRVNHLPTRARSDLA